MEKPKQQIIKLINNLFQLSRNNSEKNESEAAYLKALELMNNYSLTPSEINSYFSRKPIDNWFIRSYNINKKESKTGFQTVL